MSGEKKPTWVVDKERGRRAEARETVWLFGLHAVRDALMNPNREKIRLVVTKNALDKLEEAQRRMAELARYGFSLGAEPMPLPTCDLLPPCLCNELMLLCVNLHGHAGTRF